MTDDLAAIIRQLGATRSYADGAEETVLSILERVVDRSDGSDELNRHSVDWATTYHLSPRRSNLLRPIVISAEDRILEIGAGTGVLTRYLGERGASVVALEGDPTRAKAVALRCSGLDNVEVVCGLLDELDDPSSFDLVIVVGVLEYAGGTSQDSHDQLEFLRRATVLAKPEGALVLAIENQLGLKYLLGFSEDHLAEPWAGIEGYPNNPPIRTFSRSKLKALLADSGWTEQRWLYPYPDYKLPTTILAEQVFELPNSTDFVDQLVGSPVQDLANPPTRFCDDRSSHLVFLEAGLGPEVANSFLVVAARHDAALGRVTDVGALAWHFSSERLKCWRRWQLVRRDVDGISLSAVPSHLGEAVPRDTWLKHVPHKDDVFLIGRTVEQQALEWCRKQEVDNLSKTLRGWHQQLKEHERGPSRGDSQDHPFSARADQAELPPELLDVSLSNFVDTGDSLAFVDREWHAGRGVDAELARFRALWYFALNLVFSGSGQPFDPSATVNAIAVRLSELAGLDSNNGLIEEFFPAEARLQEIVTGTDAEAVEKELRGLGSSSRVERKVASNLPVAQIRRDMLWLGKMLGRLERQAEGARSYHLRLEKELERVTQSAQELEVDLDRLRAWKQRILERPLVWAALAIYRFFERGDTDH